VSSFYVFGADGYSPADKEPHPSVLSSLAFVAALGAAVMLVWRHRVLWAGGALVYLATALALWRDLGWHKEVTIAGELFATTMPAKLISVLVMAALLTAIPLTVGILRGTRADLRRRELSERELRDEVTRQEERSRIAHEMHDVLGHRLSLLSLQAGALEVSPTAAPEVARTVRTTARQSLADLRQVIGVLRDGRDFQLAGGPAPALVDLPALVASTREAGVPVT
jgi:signal transduction histidine kinase